LKTELQPQHGRRVAALCSFVMNCCWRIEQSLLNRRPELPFVPRGAHWFFFPSKKLSETSKHCYLLLANISSMITAAYQSRFMGTRPSSSLG
jgi:hypothetical protein